MQIESESDRAREMSKIDPKLHIFMLHYRKLLRAWLWMTPGSTSGSRDMAHAFCCCNVSGLLLLHLWSKPALVACHKAAKMDKTKNDDSPVACTAHKCHAVPTNAIHCPQMPPAMPCNALYRLSLAFHLCQWPGALWWTSSVSLDKCPPPAVWQHCRSRAFRWPTRLTEWQSAE